MIRPRFLLFFAADDGVTIPVSVPLVRDDSKTVVANLQNIEKATEDATNAAKENAAAMDAQAAATEKLSTIQARVPSANDRAYNAQINSSAAAAMASPLADDAAAVRAAREERVNSVLSQRQAILEQEVALLAAERAGEEAKAAALTRELAERRETLAIYRAGLMTEEEAMAIARQKVTLEAEITAQKEAQALADREAAAAAKIHGERGRVGAMLQNAGLDTNAAAIAGIGVLGGMEAARFIDEMINKMQEEARETARTSAELTKQSLEWQNAAKSAGSMNDVISLVHSMSGAMEKLNLQIEETPLVGKSWDGLLDRGKALVKYIAEATNPGGAVPDNMLQLSGSKQMDELQVKAKNAELAFVKMFQAAIKNADEMKQIMGGPAAEGIAALTEKINKQTQAQQNQNQQTAAGIIAWAEAQQKIDRYSAAIEKLQTEQQKDDDFYDKLTAQAEAEYLAEEKRKDKVAEITHELSLQQAIQEALLNGDEDLAKSIQRQLEYEREKRQLEAAGLPDADAQASRLRDLRQQVDEKAAAEKRAAEAARDAEKQQKIADQEALERAQAHHRQREVDAAQRKKFMDDRRKALEDANYSPDDVQSHLDEDMRNYDRTHRKKGVIDAHAPMAKPKSGLNDVSSPSAPLDPNDTMRDGENGPSKDFSSLGSHMDINKSAPPSSDFQKLKPLGDGGQQNKEAATQQKAAADSQKQAASDQKSAANDAKSAATDFKDAANLIKVAAASIQSAAAAMAANTGSPNDNDGGTLGSDSVGG